MGFLLNEDNAWLLLAMPLGAFLFWRYSAHIGTVRFWMWAVGLSGIAILIWVKGDEEIMTWLLATGWFAALVHCDRLFVAPRA